MVPSVTTPSGLVAAAQILYHKLQRMFSVRGVEIDPTQLQIVLVKRLESLHPLVVAITQLPLHLWTLNILIL